MLPFLFFAQAEAQAAGFQRAKVPLKAKTTRPTNLLRQPKASASSMRRLSGGTEVLVLGREDSYFLVEIVRRGRKLRGWALASRVQVRGPSKKAAPASAPKPKVSRPAPSRAPKPARNLAPSSPPPSSPRRGTEVEMTDDSNLKTILRGGYAFGVKSYEDQFRGGVDVLYQAWSNADVGGTVEAGFKNGTTIAVGPTFSHKVDLPYIKPVILEPFGGLRYFYVSANSETDHRFGVSAGLRSILLRSAKMKFLLYTSADLLMTGGSEVSIPVSAGVGMQFGF